MAEIDLAAVLLRGALSALAVAGLLWAAQRWGRGLAGLLAGLPSVTGPALVWLTMDRGLHVAAEAAQGAVLAALPCALFAVVYARLVRQHGRLSSLGAASLATALPLPLLLQPGWPWAACLVLAAASSLAGVALIPRSPVRVLPPSPAQARARAESATVLVAGLVTALCTLLGPVLPPLWLGALTSPPLLAAAIVWALHGQGYPGCVQEFLRGYTAGLLGRSAFVALFCSLLLHRQGLATALAGATLSALAVGWCTHQWMRWRGKVMMMREAPP